MITFLILFIFVLISIIMLFIVYESIVGNKLQHIEDYWRGVSSANHNEWKVFHLKEIERWKTETDRLLKQEIDIAVEQRDKQWKEQRTATGTKPKMPSN